MRERSDKIAALGLVIFNAPLALKLFKRILEFVGFSTAPEDAMGLLEKLSAMPWPLAFFMAFTAWVTYLLYPSLMRVGSFGQPKGLPVAVPAVLREIVTIGTAIEYIRNNSAWGEGKTDTDIYDALVYALRNRSLKSWGRKCLNWSAETDARTPSDVTALEFFPGEENIFSWLSMTLWQESIGGVQPNRATPQMTIPDEPHYPDFILFECYGYVRVDFYDVQLLFPPRVKDEVKHSP